MKKHTKRKTALSILIAIIAISATVLTVLHCKNAADKRAAEAIPDPMSVAFYDSTNLAFEPECAEITDLVEVNTNEARGAPSTAATNIDEVDQAPMDTEYEENDEVTEAEKLPTDSPAKSESTDSDKLQTNTSASGMTASNKNVFEDIYSWFECYLGDVFSALAFAVGLAVALIYKKGLVPGIARVGAAIKESVDTAVEAGEKLKEDTANADLKLDGLTSRLNSLCSELDTMKGQLDLAGALEERAKIQNVLLMEIDLLYTVFTSSSLPEYMKAELDRRVGAMRRELSQNE